MGYRKRNNAVVDKTFEFACQIVFLSDKLKENKDYELASQLLRAGTSIGANTRESQRGSSTKDFANKLKIALKEAEEVEFWLDVLDVTRDYKIENYYKQLDEIIRLLVSIIKSTNS
ncbi:four helix bundle protein [Nonlabens spongiae]|uniref:Four helix bundle protein n=1 Tax=Nonlabens spongiae TaxID=331648 RepID=A0A1W6ML74_9FLAO|nr:four helix bundle protein [Nonlabens spongiae]ARN78345.1 four helix bundle protein [Nonlabens spongiae]